MALRVLLADESSTIKKVMQLALQDFAVEVKAVHAGIDVLDVARAFQPDVIFADVLLQKKNGYEVCALLKADASLKAVPVVLMWSSFMDLDDQLAKNSGSNGRLEKPFDAETLRKLVLELVPKTRSQRLAHFLDFPEKATEELRLEEESKQAPAPTPTVAAPKAAAKPTAPPIPAPQVAPQAPPAPTSWNMESFDDPAAFADEIAAPMESHEEDDDEAFKPLELSNFENSDDEPSLKLDQSIATGAYLSENTSVGGANFQTAQAGDDESWTHQDLSRFKLDLPPVTVQNDEGSSDIEIDMGEQEFTNPGMDETDTIALSPSAPPPARERHAPLGHNPLGDLQSDLGSVYGQDDEIEMPEPSLHLEAPEEELSLESSTLSAGKIPRVSADQLEEIIRAQSRDIIESVVRKIVPDLATAIIREELERLLEDTAIREARGGKGSQL